MVKPEISAVTMAESDRKPAGPGKKWVKVKKTKTYMDADGYMCTSDYSSMEEKDEEPPKKRMPPAPKSEPKKKAEPKKQTGIGSFFNKPK